MPSYVTHHIFAQTVQRVTEDSVAHIAASYPAGYRWGAQGPEPLSQYHTPFPSQTHRLAQRMRTEPPAPLFEALCEAAVQEHNTAALAYVFGFCTNYALDRVTHAFIAAQAERLALYVPGYSAEARRKLAESDIDGILIANYIGAEPAAFEAYRLLDPNAAECIVLARVVSAGYNFFLNYRVVFKSSGAVWKSAVRYFVLAVVQMLASAGLVSLLYGVLGGSEVAVKILVDVFLFFISFLIQREIVYR